MGRPERLISRAIELLHKARFMLDQTGAGNAVAASAANPKFASQLPRVRLRTSGSKRH